MNEDHLRRLESMYLAAPCNQAYCPKIAIREGEADIAFAVGPPLHHAAGAVHGANYFKAMDDAAFFAVNSLVHDVFVLTVSFNVYLLRPITEGEMRAGARVVSRSRNLWVAEVELCDDRGRTLGRGSGSFMRSRIALADVPAYAEG